MRTRTMTIDHERYKITESYSGEYLHVRGSRIVGGITLVGIDIDSPDMREHLAKEIVAYWERHKAASEMIQQRVKEGRY